MRVPKLVGNADEYDGWRVHPQAPAIGDLDGLVERLPRCGTEAYSNHVTPTRAVRG